MLRLHCHEALEPRQLLAIAPLSPLAADDDYSTTEDQILVGNVIAGQSAYGTDISADPSLPMKIVEVNGQAAIGGVPLTFASGATLAISSDGAFSFDPSHGANPVANWNKTAFATLWRRL